MRETLEEFTGRHIDGLYHGALFLNGGEEPLAEDLVLWTLTGAFHEFRQIEEASALERWIEGKLVEVFLARTVSGDDGSTDGDGFLVDAATNDGLSSGALAIDPDALFGAAAKMPPLARAAIWLVLFRRWHYGEASSVLGTDVDGLKDLLRYRQVLVSAVVRGTLDRNGTDDDRRH
jgi:DNA-directed RNA polymerase specialized sigma24 family protein